MNSTNSFVLDGQKTDFYLKEKNLRVLIESTLNNVENQSKTCAIYKGNKLNYDELRIGALSVARALANYELVAVCMQPSFELIITLCGIIIQGITYVPLEPALPLERIEYILKDSDVPLLIVDGTRSISVKTTKIMIYNEIRKGGDHVDRIQKRSMTSEDIFCIMYTSGSTGYPKGVRLPHRALLNRLHWQWLYFPFNETDVCCFKTSISFVDSIAEIFAPLLRTIPIVILPKSTLLNIDQLIDTLAEEKISRIILVPSLLALVLEYLKRSQTCLNALQMIVCSGENLPCRLIDFFFTLKNSFAADCRLLNLYGSTEVMADVTYEIFQLKNYAREQLILNDRTSIGKPIDNVQVRIIDPDERGVGELLIIGDGVANGYHRNDTNSVLLENKFIQHTDGTFQFRTGDLGQIHNKRIFLHGRTDTQIKIAGNRVDLTEIELKLKQYCQCQQPIAMHSMVHDQIVVFLETEENPCHLTYEYLSKYLPSYAVPNRFIRIDRLPLLVSGKIDRSELKKLAQLQPTITIPVDTKNREESTIATAFYTALAEIGIPKAYIDRNFVDAGGSSLNALTLISKLHHIGFQDLNVERLMHATSLKDILNDPSILKNQKRYDPFSKCDVGYEVLTLDNIDRIKAQQLLIDSFIELSEIDALVHVHQPDLKHQCKLEWFLFLDTIWNYYMNAGLSFGILDHDGQLIGIALSKDLNDEPSFIMPSLPLLGPLFSMFENGRHELIKNLKLRQLLPDSIMHGFLTAVSPSVAPHRRITIMYFLERQVLELAAIKEYQAVITANASSVTQQLAEQVFNYDFNHIIYANRYRDHHGNLVFPQANNHHTAVISMKLLQKN